VLAYPALPFQLHQRRIYKSVPGVEPVGYLVLYLPAPDGAVLPLDVDLNGVPDLCRMWHGGSSQTEAARIRWPPSPVRTSQHFGKLTDKAASLLDMTDPSRLGHDDPRWQYMILWRYGALVLVIAGLLAMGFGAAGVCGTAISLSLLPIGFVGLVAGVVLPRIEGKFTAGPSGLTAEMLAVHELDQPWYVLSGPALATETTNTGDVNSSSAPGTGTPDTERITIGDVWDALDARGLRADAAAAGHAYFQLRGDRHLEMPNRGFMDWGTASDELLAVLRTWGVQPRASGKYPIRSDVRPDFAKQPAGSLQDVPAQS
jgi:hypothetical protein